MTPMVYLHTRIPPELRDELEQRAEMEHRELSQMVRILLQYGLAHRPKMSWEI